MAMRWRCPPLNWWGKKEAVTGIKPHVFQQFAHPHTQITPPHTLVDTQRLADDVQNLHPGVEGAVGVLEHRLHQAFVFPQSATP